jgi:hypothetical protein
VERRNSTLRFQQIRALTPAVEALKLRWPLPDGKLKIAARGEKEDREAA